MGAAHVETLFGPGHGDICDAPFLCRVPDPEQVGAVSLGHVGGDGGERRGVEQQLVGEQRGELVRIVEAPRRAGEVALVERRDEHGRPLESLGPVDGEQRHCVLAAEPGGVEFLCLVLQHQGEVVEECLKRGTALERRPLLGEVEEPVEVEPRREPVGVCHRLDLLPGAGLVEDLTRQLDQALTLSGPDQVSEQVSELSERLDGVRAQALYLLEMIHRLEQPGGRERSLGLALG